MLSRRAVHKRESHGDLVGRRVRARRDGGVGDELEGHAGGVVDDAGEVLRDGVELGEAEEGQGRGVGAELDAEAGSRLVVERGVELLEDLRGQGGARDGADGLAGVEGEVVLVLVGEDAELVESFGGEDVGVLDGYIVDRGNVDQVEHYELLEVHPQVDLNFAHLRNRSCSSRSPRSSSH